MLMMDALAELLKNIYSLKKKKDSLGWKNSMPYSIILNHFAQNFRCREGTKISSVWNTVW